MKRPKDRSESDLLEGSDEEGVRLIFNCGS